MWNFRTTNVKFTSSVWDRSLLPVRPLQRSQEKCSSSLSRCAPRVNSANMAQLSLQEVTATSFLSLQRLQLYYFWRFSTNACTVHWCQSEALPRLKFAWASGYGIHRLQPRGEEQHNRAQAVEECRPLSPRGDPGPIKCLRWHDSSPQKCHSFSAALSDTRPWSLEALWLCNSCAMRQLPITPWS